MLSGGEGRVATHEEETTVLQERFRLARQYLDDAQYLLAVSYTHLTLPTNREV